jgi:hypothetical protein
MAYGSLAATADATKNFAIDLISGAIFSRIKLAFGIEGAATDVSADNPLPVTAASLPLPAGAAAETTLAEASAKLPASLGPKAAAASLSVARANEDAAAIGALNETAPASDTASSGLNGRLQRVAQRLTTLINLLPAALANGRLKIAWRDALDVDVGTVTNPIFTSPVGATVTLVDRSGTIAAGNTQQQLVAANAARRGLWVQNNSAGDLRVNSTGLASATSGLLLPGGQNALYEYPNSGVPVTAISIWGATTGQAFEAREW